MKNFLLHNDNEDSRFAFITHPFSFYYSLKLKQCHFEFSGSTDLFVVFAVSLPFGAFFVSTCFKHKKFVLTLDCLANICICALHLFNQACQYLLIIYLFYLNLQSVALSISSHFYEKVMRLFHHPSVFFPPEKQIKPTIHFRQFSSSPVLKEICQMVQ